MANDLRARYELWPERSGPKGGPYRYPIVRRFRNGAGQIHGWISAYTDANATLEFTIWAQHHGYPDAMWEMPRYWAARFTGRSWERGPASRVPQ